MNVLRRISLARVLLLCGLVVAVGIGATALASALSAGPRPEPKPLAQAIHDALGAPAPEGVSANIVLTNRLLEGASLASAGSGGLGPSSSPLLDGGSGRLWASKDGRFRIELQQESGDTQIIWDGHTLKLYDASKNTLYRYTPSEAQGSDKLGAGQPEIQRSDTPDKHEVPSVAKIEEAISHLSEHTDVSGAEPTDVAGQPAYTVRVAPKEGGSLLGAAELSFDAIHGNPLRAAVYSSKSSSPVLELAATEISYGPVSDSVFSLTPPSDVKVEDLGPHETSSSTSQSHASEGEAPRHSTRGHGPSTILVLEGKAKGSSSSSHTLEDLPKVKIDGTTASELRTQLGTLLSFERAGVRYLLVGAVTPDQLEAVARGL